MSAGRHSRRARRDAMGDRVAPGEAGRVPPDHSLTMALTRPSEGCTEQPVKGASGTPRVRRPGVAARILPLRFLASLGLALFANAEGIDAQSPVQITEFPIGGNPIPLALGADGNFWTWFSGTLSVGRMTPTAACLIRPAASDESAAVALDGWITGNAGCTAPGRDGSFRDG